MLAYFKGKSWVSKFIKWRTWGKYSHVAWIVDRDFTFNYSDGIRTIPAGTIYESWHKKSKGATRNGVRKGVAGDLHKPGTEVDLYAIEIDDTDYAELILRMEELVADPSAKYDFRGVISGFSLRKDTAHGRNALFCSRFMMKVLRAIGIRFLINIEDHQTSPMDMAHSPIQRFVGSWETGQPWLRYGVTVFKLNKGWR